MPRAADEWVQNMPDWGGEEQGLVPVVDALEKADVPALLTALDQVDPALLNRHVQLKWCDELGDDLGQRDGMPVLFYAHACSEDMGRLPCSLLACLLFVLSDYTYNDVESGYFHHNLAIPGHTNDEWVAVVTALVNHPKMDVNTVVTIDQHWEESREYERRAYEARQCAPGDPVPGPDCGWNEDCMSPWDYLFTAVIESRSKLGADHFVTQRGMRLMCVLAASGKLDMERDLHLYYHNNVQPQGSEFTPLYATYEFDLDLVFKAFLTQKDELIMPHVWGFHRQKVSRFDASLVGNAVPYAAIKQRIAQYNLKIWRRWYRTFVFLERWYAEIRFKSYAPGGAGEKRARASFESLQR